MVEVAASRRCPRCKDRKPASAYTRNKRTRDGLSCYCKPCTADYGREWLKHNPTAKAARRAAVDAYHKRHPDRVFTRRRKDMLLRKYGMSVSDYATMFETQRGLCVICSKPETSKYRKRLRRLAVDHDHRTGRVRGLLCHMCNFCIGHANDDIATLEAMVRYLKRHASEEQTA